MDNPTAVVLSDSFVKPIQDLSKRHRKVDTTLAAIEQNTAVFHFAKDISESIEMMAETLKNINAPEEIIEEFQVLIEKLKRQNPLDEKLNKLVLDTAKKIEKLQIGSGPDAFQNNNKELEILNKKAQSLENNNDKDAIKELKSLKKQISDLEKENVHIVNENLKHFKELFKKLDNLALLEEKDSEKYSGSKAEKFTFLPKQKPLDMQSFDRMHKDLINCKTALDNIVKDCKALKNEINQQNLSEQEKIPCKGHIIQLDALTNFAQTQGAVILDKRKELVECLSDEDKQKAQIKHILLELCQNNQDTDALIFAQELTDQKHPLFINNAPLPSYITFNDIAAFQNTQTGKDIIKARIQQNPMAFASLLNNTQQNISQTDLDNFAKTLLQISNSYDPVIKDLQEKIPKIKDKISSDRFGWQEKQGFEKDLKIAEEKIQKILQEKENFDTTFKDQLAQIKAGNPIVIKHVHVASTSPTVIPVIQAEDSSSPTAHPSSVQTFNSSHRQKKDWATIGAKDAHPAAMQNLSRTASTRSTTNRSTLNEDLPTDAQKSGIGSQSDTSTNREPVKKLSQNVAQETSRRSTEPITPDSFRPHR